MPLNLSTQRLSLKVNIFRKIVRMIICFDLEYCLVAKNKAEKKHDKGDSQYDTRLRNKNYHIYLPCT